MRIRRFVLLKSFLFLNRIFLVRKSIFLKSWVCIRKLAFLSEVLSSSMALSSLVKMQPLKSFKPCCFKFLLDSYSRRSLPGFKILQLLWTNRYVYKDLIWRAESLCRLLSPSCCCRWLQIIFISGLFFDSDCFFEYTRLWVTSAWFYPR